MDLVASLRRRLGLTQERFAQRIGVTFPTVNRWENGHARPSPLAMTRLKELTVGLGEAGNDLRKKYFEAMIAAEKESTP